MDRDRHSADDHEHEEKNDEQTKSQTQLLANDRKNEVGVGIRKIGHFLPPVAETEAFDPAAAPRDQGLHLLQSSSEFVILGVKKSEQPAVTFGDAGGKIKNRAHSA